MKKIALIFLLIIILVCCGCSNSKESIPIQGQNNQNQTNLSVDDDEIYNKNLNFIEQCIPLDFFIENDAFISLSYNKNQNTMFLTKITDNNAIFVQVDLSQTTEIVCINNSIALIDYGREKSVKIYDDTDLSLQKKYDLSSYYENAMPKVFSSGDIVLSQLGDIAFVVTTHDKVQIYIMNDSSSKAICVYEIDSLNAVEGKIANITKLLLLTNDRLYFEGVILKNGIASDEVSLAYLDLNSYEIVEVKREDAISFYSNNQIIYSQDYQKSSKDSGSGLVFIYNVTNDEVSKLKTEEPQESLNGYVSASGEYYCSFGENENNKSIIKIYDVKSNEVISTINTDLTISINCISIDSKKRFLYISNSNDVMKYMEKYSF